MSFQGQYRRHFLLFGLLFCQTLDFLSVRKIKGGRESERETDKKRERETFMLLHKNTLREFKGKKSMGSTPIIIFISLLNFLFAGNSSTIKLISVICFWNWRTVIYRLIAQNYMSMQFSKTYHLFYYTRPLCCYHLMTERKQVRRTIIDLHQQQNPDFPTGW